MSSETRESAEKVLARCRALAQFTETKGEIHRTFLSSAMRDCMQVINGWMQAAGLSVFTDPAGNLRGRYPGATPGCPCLMIGSHLDTVPNGGAFDGMLGVMIGLALVESLAGRRLPFAIELIGFSEEEGVRFHLPFIGSRALAGRADAAMLATTDDAGVSIKAALESFGLNPMNFKDCVSKDDIAGFLEFHIEQGILLENENRSLAVVQAIAGQTRCEVTFHGRANHAGTTPMRLRLDAVAGAAEWILAVEHLALETPGLVATVGAVRSFPGAGNVIAGEALASLDVRHAEDSVRHHAVDRLLSAADEISQRRRLTAHAKILMDQPAVALDPEMCTMAARALEAAGVPPFLMVSGAGHDAMVIQERIPSTMIFLRSPGGLSHHPDESVRTEDVQYALAAGQAFLHSTFQPRSKEQRVSTGNNAK
jgi:allantoate deiminase